MGKVCDIFSDDRVFIFEQFVLVTRMSLFVIQDEYLFIIRLFET